MMPDGRFIVCSQCRGDMWLPLALHETARRSEEIIFHCPYGHRQHFPKGDGETTLLRRERDRLKQQLAEKDDDIKALKAVVAKEREHTLKMKSVATKVRKRNAAGLCPCCNRSFASAQMQRHIKTKHPEFKAEEVS